jgi:ribosomal protein S18 acetylase RimI-like enzyme
VTRHPSQPEIATAPVESLARDPRIVDIRSLSARELDPSLREEIAEWSRELDWDFSASAELVRTLADTGGLRGVALLDRGQVAGHGYVSLEGNKGLIADLYVRPEWRGRNAEVAIFRMLLDGLAAITDVHRIESQLMLVDATSAKALQRERGIRLFERLLMTFDASTSLPPSGASTGLRFRIEQWSDHYLDAAADVLSAGYGGHIDSQINAEYRNVDEVRRLLHKLVQLSGGARFYRPASYIAFDSATGEASGILLASFLSDEVAHIMEICVTPDARGAGLGYLLLRQAAAALRGAGAKRISLTVTAANHEAVRLYTRCGFQEIRRFHAYVWERPPEKG